MPEAAFWIIVTPLAVTLIAALNGGDVGMWAGIGAMAGVVIAAIRGGTD